MEMGFSIAQISVGQGMIGISPLPGRSGDAAGDMSVLAQWRPDVVLTLVQHKELARKLRTDLPQEIQTIGAKWVHLPIPDFGTPDRAGRDLWSQLAPQLQAHLAQGARILVHCMGGCGRSGMIALRLMVDLGEDPVIALERLRAVRPCAVETKAQQRWATGDIAITIASKSM
jgi:protein-tyrosine phosphatase